MISRFKIIFAVALSLFIISPFQVFAANATESQRFIISIGEKREDYAKRLSEAKLIDSMKFFNLAMDKLKLEKKIRPGGYKINTGMSDVQVIITLIRQPYMEWIVIPEGYRKEEIAETLSKGLGWTNKQKSDWVNVVTAADPDYSEGVYFPDTYLIPRDESIEQVAKRFVNRFNEKFATYSAGFAEKNIKWTTALKVASLVQREAANKDDMPLIAGIIWNRLDQDMKLDIDATVQYIADSKSHLDCEPCKSKDSSAWKNDLCFESDLLKCDAVYVGNIDWWGAIEINDKKIDSAYNTYLYKGLPPHPIANPGTDAIEATLEPTETDCLYYLHGSDHKIHCSKTYEEHLENISAYLKNKISL
jgi:UPF0755 protein